MDDAVKHVGETSEMDARLIWRSQADLDASLERIRGSDDVAAAMALVENWEMIELELLGGKGPDGAGPDRQ